MRYLDPKNDLTFKKVFGEHPHLLRSFLNGLLPLAPGQEVESLEYLPAELVPEVPLMKHTIVDVRCTDNFGRQFIVEMQMFWTESFKSRVLFNASKAYVKQLDRGKEYKGLQPVYALSLVNDVFEKDTEEFYHHYSIIHNELTGKRLEGLEFVFIELPKFRPKSLEEKKLQVLWLRYLTEISEKTETLPEEFFVNPEVSEAIEHLRESAFTRAQLEAYDRYWDSISTERTLFSAMMEKGLTQGIEIGREQGIELGREQGIELGREEGIELGREEGIQQTLTIIRQFSQGLSVDEIAQNVKMDAASIKRLLVNAGFV